MRTIDCNCRLSRGIAGENGGYAEAMSALDAILRNTGISHALVYHELAMSLYPPDGNRQLMELIKDYPSMLPCWVLMPPRTLEAENIDTIRQQIVDNNIRAVRLMPFYHHYLLTDWIIGDIMQAMGELGVLVIFDAQGLNSPGAHMDSNDWKAIHDIAKFYPDTKILLSNFGFKTSRVVLPLLAACPNLRIDIANFWVHKKIELICSRIGPDRVVMGTGIPVKDPSYAVATVAYLDLPDEGKAMVAWKNAAGLLAID